MTKLIAHVAIYFILVSAGLSAVPYAGDDSDSGTSPPNGLVDTYTGNLSFVHNDLVVAGAVGQYGLSWKRHAASRATQSAYLFGQGHNWTHGWQWELQYAATDAEGRAVITVRAPNGWVDRFTEVSPGQWQPVPSVNNRLIPEENGFTLLLARGGEVRFVGQKSAGGQTNYVARVVEDAVGNEWQLSWQDGRLVQVTEPAGRWLKISYQTLTAPDGAAFAVINRVSASDGQEVKYDYSFPGGANYPVLSNVRYPDGVAANYAYTSPRPGDRLLLEQADDPRADQVIRGKKFLYRSEPEAAFGQVHQVRLIEGDALFYALEADARQPVRGHSYAVTLDNGSTIYQTYNPGGKRAEEIDGLGFLSTTEYASGGRGKKIAETDPLGNVISYELDANGYTAKTTFADGTSRSWERDSRGRILVETDELKNVRRYTYDDQGRRTGVQYPDGSDETFAYNAFGQVVSRRDRAGAVTLTTYDARGLRTQTTNAMGGITTYAYDSRDHVTAVTDARGSTTRYERDAGGRVTRTIHPDGTSNLVEYDRFGQVTRTVDASGMERHIIYDGLGRQVASVDAKGRATTTEYAPPGAGAPTGRPLKSVSPLGRATAIHYDAKGRVVARTVAAGTDASATTRTTYDAAGRVISTTNPAGKSVQFVHDKRGRRIKTVTALNHATTVEYDAAGRRIRETDAKGNTTRWTYDAMGRELSKIDAKGQATWREYNATGRLAELTDAKGNTYHFEYDLLGRQTALVYPDGSRETTEYDAAGLKVRTTNRAGVIQTFAYDNRGREIRSEWSDGSQTIVKAYDAAGRMTLQDNGVSRLTFAFDEDGRLASETQDLSAVVTGGMADPVPRAVSYTYNADGQRETLGYSDSSFVQLDYNERGQLAAILGDGKEPPIASYEYDATGNARLMPRENLTETERELDAENKIIAITERATGQSNLLSELDYTYDEVGNRTATLATHDRDGDGAAEAQLDAYHYDETYQVTGADYAAPTTGIVPPGATVTTGVPATTVRYTYDAVGNRLAVDENGAVTRYAVNSLNQYTQVGAFAPTHDANGNLASMGGWIYRYDAMNRLVEATDGATSARFWYDAKNRCVARSYTKLDPSISASTSTLSLNYYDNWNLIEERDAAGAQQARYVHGRRTDEIIMITNRHGTFYPHHDVLGNVTMLTDRAGRMIERYAYSVTGQVAISDTTGNILAESAVGNRWMFTGREWISEIGLYDYRNRVYAVDLGRFLQADPIRFSAGDVNIYRYVQNNVLNYIDPQGEEWLRQEGENYVLGRDGSIIPPGGVVSVFLEDYGPAMHTFAENHDAFVGYMTNEWSLPDFAVNIPSMPVVFVVSVFEEVVNTIGSFYNWVDSWFE